MSGSAKQEPTAPRGIRAHCWILASAYGALLRSARQESSVSSWQRLTWRSAIRNLRLGPGSEIVCQSVTIRR